MQENWLLGALLTEAAAVCHTMAAVFLRRATLRGPSGKVSVSTFGGASLGEILCRGNFWATLCLRAFACYIWWHARTNAPDTTVAPLFVLVSFFTNMAGGPSLLHEQYRSHEVWLALLCIIAVVMAWTADRYVMDPWPALTTCIVDMRDDRSVMRGQGSALVGCGALWSLAVIVCIVRQWKAHRRQRQDRQALPILAGLMSGANYFVGYVGFPFCLGFDDGEPRVESGQGQIMWCIAILVLGAFSVVLAIEGARRFDCRYFVPASTSVSFFTATVMRVLLSKHWLKVHISVAAPFLVGHMILLVGPFFMSSEPAVIKLPRTLKKEEDSPQQPPWISEFSNPFKHGTVDPLPLVATPLLEMGEEIEGGDVPDAEHETPLISLRPPKHPGLRWLFRKWVGFAAAMPIVALVCVPLAFLVVAFSFNNALPRILVLAAYTAWAVGATGLRIAVFSSVGRWRIRLCTATDYAELCKGRKPCTTNKPRKSAGGGKLMLLSDPFDTPGSSSSEDDDNPWQNVHHIVVVEGACDPRRGFLEEELRGLLLSIDRSPLAPRQIGVLIVAGNHQEAVSALDSQFSHTIRWSPPWQKLKVTPSGHLYDFGKQTFSKQSDLGSTFRSHMALVTYTTADAVFHPGYFSALTFAFLSLGEMRSTTLWQPPVLHVRDYTAQSVTIRHASLFLSEHQLASLTDPMAVPLPASTCSVPLSLLRAIEGCWEPDCPWSSNLPNAGMWTKCWLTTVGRSSVKPIFLPVLRSSAREHASGGEDQGTVAQVHRYTRGLVEIAYFWSALPLALFNGRTKPSSVGCKRLLCLFLRSLPPLLGITWSHIALSTWLIVICFNWLMLIYGLRYWPDDSKNSSAFLFCATAALFGVGTHPLLSISHVALIDELPLDDLLPPCAKGDGPCASRFFRRPILHVLDLLFSGLLAGPVLFAVVVVTEWRMGCRLMCERGAPVQEAVAQSAEIQRQRNVRARKQLGEAARARAASGRVRRAYG